MSEKTYVKHIKTGEVFEVKDTYIHDTVPSMSVYDDHGEVRLFKREVLTPYDPEEAWEDVPNHELGQDSIGLWARVDIKTPGFACNWQHVPGSHTRTITRDGKLVVQRRKG